MRTVADLLTWMGLLWNAVILGAALTLLAVLAALAWMLLRPQRARPADRAARISADPGGRHHGDRGGPPW